MVASRSILDYYLDFESLKIMLVLYRDNPDLTLAYLEKETRISKDKLSQIIAELIESKLIIVRESENNQLYTLSESARFGFDRVGVALVK